jgi:hypothetical protein
VTEHTWKWLKVEYRKSRVPGSWDQKDSVSAKKYFKKIMLLYLKNVHVKLLPPIYNAKYESAKDWKQLLS